MLELSIVSGTSGIDPVGPKTPSPPVRTAVMVAPVRVDGSMFSLTAKEIEARPLEGVTIEFVVGVNSVTTGEVVSTTKLATAAGSLTLETLPAWSTMRTLARL